MKIVCFNCKETGRHWFAMSSEVGDGWYKCDDISDMIFRGD